MTSTTPRTLCAALPHATPGDTVRLQGWVHRRRELAALTFLVVRDRTGLAQVVVKDAGSRGAARGDDRRGGRHADRQRRSPRWRRGDRPAGPAAHRAGRDAAGRALAARRSTPSLPTLLDHAPVTWRHPAQRAAWELAAASLRGFRSTLDGLGFTEIQTPKFVASATESGANVFEVDYFGRPAYLAQSPQFYKQQMVGVFERVYEVGPVFRAEPHDTVRHLAEYVSLDVELGFIEDHRDVLAVLRQVVAGMVDAVHEHAGGAVERLGRVAAGGARRDPGRSTSPRRSRWSARRPTSRTWRPSTSGRWARGRWREHGSDFVAVEGYPMAQAAVLHAPAARRTRSWSNSFDLLFRGLELVTGGQRLHRPVGLRRGDPRARRGPGRRTRRTSRRSGTGCRRTAGSRSGSSAGWPGWSRRPTSARSRCSPATSPA